MCHLIRSNVSRERICGVLSCPSNSVLMSVFAAGIKMASKAKQGDEQTLESSWGRGHRQHKKRNSLDDFIVDDDDDDDDDSSGHNSDGGSSYGSVVIGGSESGDDDDSGEEEARKAAIDAVLNQELTDDFTSWAGDGTMVEEMVLQGLKGTGSEAACKFQFLEALLKDLIKGGHKVLIFSKWKITLNLVEVSRGGRRGGGPWRCC